MDLTERKDILSVGTSRLKLHFSKDFYCFPEVLTNTGWKGLAVPKPVSTDRKPLHSLQVDNQQAARFLLQSKRTSTEEITGDFGRATRVILYGTDERSLLHPISLELQIEIYQDFPSTVIIRSRFLVEDEFPTGAQVDLLTNQLLIDGRQTGGDSVSDMWVYNGSAELREHCLQALTPNYFKKNYLGVLETADGGGYQPDYRHGSQPGFGGGTPVISLWNQGLGIAIGHLEPVFKRCSMPVCVSGESVSIGLIEHRRELPSGTKIIESQDTFINHHDGDFFNALSEYRKLMACRKMFFSTPVTGAYEPQWDTWGFRENFKPEDVIETVPHLKDIGIYWITLDDRWFDVTGDWNPRPDRFPGGDEEFRIFIEKLHEMGMKVRLWTIPAEADGDPDTDRWLVNHPSAATEVNKHGHHTRSRFIEENPNWIVIGPNGDPELSKRGNCFCCGSLAEVQNYFRETTEKMFRTWRIDGLKQDAVYMCPACFSREHNHSYPDHSSESYGRILKTIYETAMAVNPEAVIVNCPCGTTMTPDWMQWQNQAISPDPWTSWVNRGIVKQMKALFGPSSAVVLDHIELSDEGQDFSLIGVGGVPATRITPTGCEKTFGDARKLSFDQKKRKWKKWIGLYRQLMLSRGEYLNLYDIVYDKPETHVVKKDGKLYFGFYPGEPDGIIADQRDLYKRKKHTKHFSGTIEFRGLEKYKTYRVYDYENQVILGYLEGGSPYLKVEMDHHLLLELSETVPGGAENEASPI